VLYLNATGKAAWDDGPTSPTIHGLELDQPQDITITNQGRSWLCPVISNAGQALKSQSEGLTLRRFGEQLVIFELSTIPKATSLFSLEGSDDKEGALRVEQVSTGVWHISGARIFEVEADEQDLVIQSPQYLRLYDMKRKAMRWEKETPMTSKLFDMNRIFCLSGSYVVVKHGEYHLLKRSNGSTRGKFDLPEGSVQSLHQEDRFGPLMSSSGLVLYKPCANILYILRISSDKVEYHILGSETKIVGSFVLLGDLEKLEWHLLDGDVTMKEPQRCIEKVRKTTFVYRFLER
jgi:hypothetical protein